MDGNTVIYLDHNATTPLHPRVLEKMVPYLTEQFGNPSSFYGLGREARNGLEQAREKVAGGIGAREDEIVFTSGGTEADNLALRGVARALREKGNHIITSVIEHHAVLKTCEDLATDGFEVTFLPVDGQGLVDPEKVRRCMRPETILISIMAANNETGAVQPLREIVAAASERGVLVHTDAVQAIGKVEVDVDKLGVDLLSLSAHKLYGPKGVGALYVRRGTPLLSPMSGGHHERGVRAGTENVAGAVGLGEALVLATENRAEEMERLARLRDRLERGLQERIDDARVNSGEVERVANTTNLSFRAVDGEAILLHLDLRGICASTGSACATDSPEPSHVLQGMGLEPRLAQGTIRFSLGHDSTQEEVERTIEAMAEIVKSLRAISSVA
ncbi:MAG: cysteine desulfurase [Gemmatimonadetes bacterium]|nr:cysteine desulfurase [Gemmatimonadota bacterium]